MNHLNSALCNVLRSKNKLCSLCFKTIAAEDETTRFRDQVVLETETCPETELLYNILSVPSPEFLNSVPKSELLCIKCTRSATNDYTFIQMCKTNVINLNNAIDSMARSLENTIENIHNYKSLFLSINMDARICQQYYDTSSFHTLTAALKKFNRLSRCEATLSSTEPKSSKGGSGRKATLSNTKPKSSKGGSGRKATLSNTKPKSSKGGSGRKATLSDTKPKSSKGGSGRKATLSNTKPKSSKGGSDHSTRILSNMKNTHTSMKRIRFMYDVKNETYCLIRTVDGYLRYQCKFCFQVYSDLNDFQHHECIKYEAHVPKPVVAPNSESSTRICSQCRKTFTSNLLLKVHELSHIRKLVCPNSECKRVYRNRPAYLHHIEYNTCRIENVRKCNRGLQIFQCVTCKHMYATKKGLQEHVKLVHDTTFQKLECKWCGMKFVKQSTLRTHIVKHRKDKKFKCEQCGGAFLSSYRLTRHVRLHFNPTSRLYIKGIRKVVHKQTGAAGVNNTGHGYPKAGQKQTRAAGINNAGHSYPKAGLKQTRTAYVNNTEHDYAKRGQKQTGAADVNNAEHDYAKTGQKQTGAADVNNAEHDYAKTGQK